MSDFKNLKTIIYFKNIFAKLLRLDTQYRDNALIQLKILMKLLSKYT